MPKNISDKLVPAFHLHKVKLQKNCRANLLWHGAALYTGTHQVLDIACLSGCMPMEACPVMQLHPNLVDE